MASVVMADDGIAFDGATAEAGPLGGAETAFVALAEALAARGHDVRAFSRGAASMRHRGVNWAPIDAGTPSSCDLYIGNRGHRLIGLVPRPQRRVLWLHNPARYLRKPRMSLRIAWYRPLLVATGAYHASTIPGWLLDGGRVVIPYGVLDRFRHAELREPPAPRAVFTSNPLRGLDWLLDLWVRRIRREAPEAELHIYAGNEVYGGGSKHAEQINAVLSRADTLRDAGVHRHRPVGREELVKVLTGARAMLYRGDSGETFCLALAEAQALGVPAVVTPLGSVGERVADGVSGRVAGSDDAFVEAAIAVLRDDALWRRWHQGALAKQRGLSWDEVARRFEALIP
jgi:glycosyltransferase involved in cell wall biosynthesis